MARLEKVVQEIVAIFNEYADDQGEQRKLCKQELQSLLATEIQSQEFKDAVQSGRKVRENIHSHYVHIYA